jgi:hypothetical protein
MMVMMMIMVIFDHHPRTKESVAVRVYLKIISDADDD